MALGRGRRRGRPCHQRYGGSCCRCQCHSGTEKRGISGPLSSTQAVNCALIRTRPAGWCLGKKKKLFLYPAYLNLQITNVRLYTLARGWPRDKEAFLCLGGRAGYEDDSLFGSFGFPPLLKPHPCKPSGICLDLPGSSKTACTRPGRIKAISVTTLLQ